MPEDYYSTKPALAPRRGPSLRAMLATTILAFAGGAALVGYLLWDGKVTIKDDGFAIMSADPSPSASPAPLIPSPSAAPSSVPTAAPALPAGAADQRIATLEQRLARLDLQAAAAEGNAARAEGLLIAFAARRAVERGAPLGYLADQLKLRFSAAQPAAVQTVINAAAQPVTLDQLAGQLDAMTAELTNAPKEEGGWQRLRRELSGLFVVRHDDAPSANPQSRLDRARLMLRTGQVDAAADEVARLPGAAQANDWIGLARRYAGAQKALDLIETTALLDPDKLKTASGQSVQQPSPAGPNPLPVPEASF
ncbi:hypothetical protein ACFFF7_13635 [Novosphingobium aquiterrae]|uniref:Tetratricopeptide repeat protein n=1 Tax=Novosphingobium aquiterrae TaxID=624388 RepID=A0ABV6PKR4_9SPHN